MNHRDCIQIKNLQIFAHHGVFEEEKQNGQDFFLNVKLYLDLHIPGKSDCLVDALDYGACSHFIKEVFTEKSYDLIEKACEETCQRLLLTFDRLEAVELEVQKPHAPIGLPFENVSVCMYRKWHTAYLSFGSNMGDSEALIKTGIAGLKKHPLIRNVVVSELVRTKPYGGVEQADFVNGCLKLETLLDQEELLDYMHELESQANRERIVRWGPRTLDLDIVFFDKLVYESDTLIIPHVDMHNRMFVLEPLAQLCPNYRHPLLGKTVSELRDTLRKEQIDEGSII